MNRKWVFWFALGIAGLFAGYRYYRTNREDRLIAITVKDRRPGDGIPRAGVTVVYEVGFYLDAKYRLKELKVFTVDDFEHNNSPEPLWHLISGSNSVPTASFLYGQRITGMK